MAKSLQYIGVSELSHKYLNISSSLTSVLTRFLRENAQDEVNKSIEENFRTESDSGGKWKQLSPYTVRERELLGFPGKHPILYRTGDLFQEAMGNKSLSKRVVKYNSEGASLLVRLSSLKAIEQYNYFSRDFMDFREKNKRNVRSSLNEVMFNLLQSK